MCRVVTLCSNKALWLVNICLWHWLLVKPKAKAVRAFVCHLENVYDLHLLKNCLSHHSYWADDQIDQPTNLLTRLHESITIWLCDFSAFHSFPPRRPKVQGKGHFAMNAIWRQCHTSNREYTMNRIEDWQNGFSVNLHWKQFSSDRPNDDLQKIGKKSFGQHAVWSIGIPPVEQATSFPWRHLILYRICKILIEGKTKRIPSEWLKHRRTKKFVAECRTHDLKVVGSNPGIIHWMMLFFTYICCKNCNDVCLKRLKINDKKGRGWPVF